MNTESMKVCEAPVSYLTPAEAPEVPPGYKRTEVGVIPDDWEAIPLGELFAFKNGLNKARRFFGFGTPIVNYMDVYDHPGLRIGDLHGRVSLSSHEIKNFEVRQGDVFFTRTSETVEEIGVAAVMLEQPTNTVFSGFVLRARPKHDMLDDAYKQYCFTTPGVRSQVVSTSTYTTRALTNGRSLSAVCVAVPARAEQRAIAEALSDVDGLLEALEALIAKKRAIKQAAMQQLLTGKTRLPGFNGTWETKRLGDVAHIKTGSRNNEDKVPDGQYPFFVRSERVECINTYSHDCEAILVPGEGRIGDIFHYVKGRFDVHQRVYAITRFAQEVSGEFVYFYMAMRFGAWAMQNTVKATVDSLRLPTFRNFTMEIPRTIGEQIAIATVLSDMDAEIAALERRRDKTRAIKQGMMQQLLTGRIRLLSEMVSE
jgi:type I restriction enzyme S subunit